MTYDYILQDNSIQTYIRQADAAMAALGFTEHSFPHVKRVAQIAGDLLQALGYSPRTVELARIAGYLHDIGNMINRADHSQSGALIAFRVLDKMDFPAEEIAAIVTAIGNHDEGTGVPVSPIAAALIIADKSDVRRSRVRCKEDIHTDIHDRVNYSVTSSILLTNSDDKTITLQLTVDPQVSSVMEYFEIFMKRMILCRAAANSLGLTFHLIVNDQILV